MTSIDTWPIWITLIVAGGPILLALLNFAYSMYLSRYHLDALKEALKNSRYIYIWGPSLGKRGVIWSLLEIVKIMGIITMPKTHIRRGDLDEADYENFPLRLKRLLKIKAVILLGAWVWSVLVYILIKIK